MLEFISLQCQTCGGRVQVKSNANDFRCEHCGATFLIRRNANGVKLEAFAQCPICKRNDRAEKVSSIVRNQTRIVQKIVIKEVTEKIREGDKVKVIIREVPVTQDVTEMTDLARHLSQPTQEKLVPSDTGPNTAYLFLTLGIATAFIAFCSLLFAVSSLGSLVLAINGTGSVLSAIFFIIISLLAIVAFSVCSFVIFKTYVPKENLENEKRKEEYEDCRLKIEAARAKDAERWVHINSAWSCLYYCARDDVVFIPGEVNAAPVDGMKEYLQCLAHKRTSEA